MTALHGRCIVGGLLGLWLTLSGAPAVQANGVVVLSSQTFDATHRATLSKQIAAARLSHPDMFTKVAALRQQMPIVARGTRSGRLPSISRGLKALGPHAVLPMIEQLAFDAPPRGRLSETAFRGWRASLIEAVGMLRDPRAEPVLVAILDGDTSDAQLVRTTAEALARLGTDSAAAKLIALLRGGGERQPLVLAAIGNCRRTVVARELSRLLAEGPDARTARRTIDALGDAGNAWAWTTPAVSASGEGAAVRSLAATALLAAFVRYDGELRRAATNALLLVGDPATKADIARARAGAAPKLRDALDALARRVEHSPLR